jgi:4-hydroxy-2-oxovalerate/4-hydroxy-2-oxohexanoate aldolase
MRSKPSVLLHDMCLRDGMHAKRHRFSIAQMVELATALDDAGVPLIEISHGDGLAGSSITYGFAAHTDVDYLSAVIPKLRTAKVSALLIPGIGTAEDLHRAREVGVSTIRVATQCTEADVAEQHLALARRMELDTVGFLMMAHMLEPAELLRQAKMMESYGANCVYCTDSAGYMLPEDVSARVRALRQGLSPQTEVGFHGHHNLALGVANSLVAIEAGASRIDGSAAGLGAGAGNTPLEVLNAVLHRKGIETGVDVFRLMDVAEERVVQLMDQPIRIDRDALMLGYAGVYSSFLLHAKRAQERYGVPAHELLIELGRLKTVGGQEDMIEDIALRLQQQRRRAG